MAFLPSAFDASAVEPSAPIDILPPGKYPAEITHSEMKETSKGGQMLVLEMTICDGANKGRKLWDRLNLVNPNAQAVEIAQRTLSAICRAADRMQVTDSEQLHFRPMLVTVGVEEDNRDAHLAPHERRKRNNVKGYEALGGGGAAHQAPATSAPRQAPPPPPPPTVAAGRPASPPWRRAG